MAGPHSDLSCIDAGTLTDDELSAAIDKESGYIRFTLRKRRKDHCNRDTQTCDPSTDQDNRAISNELSQTKLHEQKSSKDPEQPLMSKRTRLTGSFEAEQSEPAMSDTQSGRRYSEQVNLSTRRTNSLTQESIHHWFAVNLPGLVEYKDKFLVNGFNDLRMMNHLKLVNDQSLIAIGIEDESHRELIKDTISNDLPKVDLGELVKVTNDTSIQDMLMGLKLAHLLTRDHSEILSRRVTDLEALHSLIPMTEGWPVGYKNRLLWAVEAIADELDENDSSMTNDEADTTRVSQTFSLSSSQDSIKSIVMMRGKTGESNAAKQEDSQQTNQSPVDPSNESQPSLTDPDQKPAVSPTALRPVRKLDAIRMRFEKQIEESNKKNIVKAGDSLSSGAGSARPKPPPPAKPAKLLQAASKYNEAVGKG